MDNCLPGGCGVGGLCWGESGEHTVSSTSHRNRFPLSVLGGWWKWVSAQLVLVRASGLEFIVLGARLSLPSHSESKVLGLTVMYL